MNPYWSIPSMILYISLGLVSMCAVIDVKRKELKSRIKYNSVVFMVWFAIWLVFAVWRKVDIGVGGSDAITYVQYFNDCLNPGLNTLYAQHLDKGFQLLTKLIRVFIYDYHGYFIIIYGIIIACYQRFVYELAPTNVYYEPMVLLFFIFLRGYSTLRTNISIAFLLMALVACYKKEYKKVAVYVILSFGMHIASLLYIAFFLFYYIYEKKRLSFKQGLYLYIAALVGAKIVQSVLMKMTGLRGAYSSYASKSLNTSFFDDGWKIAFGQLLLLALMIVFRKSIKRVVVNFSAINKSRYQFVYKLCFYDFLMIPVCYILGIWRGYEYFYIPRLIMWGVLMKGVLSHFNSTSKIIVRILFLVLFIAWMIFRVFNTYESSALMPYVLDIF